MSARDEQIAVLRAEARRKYQVMIDYIKDQVGPGAEYLNDLVRVVLSERGCYYEFLDMPEEFSGAVGSGFRHAFVGYEEAIGLLEQIRQLVAQSSPENTRELALLVVYSRNGLYDPEETYVYHVNNEEGDEEQGESLSSGCLRADTLPIFFKIKVDSDLALPLLGVKRGVLFFVANMSDQHLLVRIPHEGNGVTNLAQVPASQLIH
jgi:hypothetical protein